MKAEGSADKLEASIVNPLQEVKSKGGKETLSQDAMTPKIYRRGSRWYGGEFSRTSQEHETCGMFVLSRQLKRI